MKVKTMLIHHILENSKANLSYRHILAGKRQTGKTTAGIMGGILRGLESCKSEYEILVIAPTYNSGVNIANMLGSLSEKFTDVNYHKYDERAVLKVGDEIKFNIDIISSNYLDNTRGRGHYDFGIIEEFNHCNDWKECLQVMIGITDDFIILSEAEL